MSDDQNSHTTTIATPVPPQSATKKERPRRKLYQPSVYRYKCLGDLEASSDHIGSRGFCRGIETRLQHVRDLYPSTREEAIHNFCQETSYPPQQNNNSGEPHQHETLNSLLNIHHAIIYDEDEHHDINGRQASRNEEGDEMWQDWSSYGYTTVDFLVLRDVKSKEEKVAGVAPECQQGITIRGIGNNDGSENSYSFRILWLEIMLRESSKNEQQQQQRNGESSPLPDQGTVENDQRAFSERFLEASKKIATHMKQNAGIVKEAVSDDFAGRTIKAGQRIATELGKNVDRTSAFLGALYRHWRDDGRDNK